MQSNQSHEVTTEDGTELLLKPHELIKRQRLSLGLSEHHIAALCDISKEQYLRYESGRRTIYSASFQLGVKLCYYLQINLYDLFSLEQAETREGNDGRE